MKNCIFISFLLFIFLLFVDNSYSATTLVRHDFNLTSQYATTSLQFCSFTFGVVFDDPNKIIKVNSPIYSDVRMGERVFYEGTSQVYQIIVSLPLGTYNSIPINVNNSIEITPLTIQFPQPFECKKFSATNSPLLDFTSVSDFTYETIYGYVIKIDFNENLPVGSIKSCELSISSECMIIPSTSTYFTINTFSGFDLSKFSSEKITVKINDYYGGSRTIEFDNPIVKNVSPSVIKSISISPANNSLINAQAFESQLIRVHVTYSELNSYQILKKQYYPGISNNDLVSVGNLILGTPEEQVLMFTSSVQRISNQNFSFIDYSPEASIVFTLNYTGYVPQGKQYSIVPVSTVVQSTETSNLLLKVYVEVPTLEVDLQVQSISNSFTSQGSIEYPYGISKSNKDSYFKVRTESLFPFSTYGGLFYIIYGSDYYYNVVGNSNSNAITIPNYPGIITSDPEGPIVRHFAATKLENNKILFTLNITDVGSGLLYIRGGIPNINILAKEVLVSGDINNGIYQFVVDTDLVFGSNTLNLLCYDYMGNYNQMVYSDLNLNTFTLYDAVSVHDITYFKFNRHQIDTSFNDLELILSISYTGANEYSAIPVLAVIYSDIRYGNVFFKGIWNKTTELFDIKINVQARHRGYFEYYLISPTVVYPYQFEQRFPEEKVLLTSNYVDHYPPLITNFKSITNTQLSVLQGDSIELGWDIEIYDYPVGLDYAVFEVSSDKDFEPRVFTFKPDTLISGSDINSTYSIRFKVKPLVNQVFFISKCYLVDKNGYYSSYPYKSDITVIATGFDAFFKGTFDTERRITVTLNSQSSDIKAPELLSLTIPPTSFDSFGIDRVAHFEFSIKDDISGISERHDPYVYVQFLYNDYYRVQSKRVSIDSNTGIAYYNASIKFDYGRLAHGALISIHGVVDNALNTISYTSEDIKALGFVSSMVNPISNKPPVILENSQLNEDGGRFYIYGREFGEQPIVYMDRGDGLYNAVPSMYQSNLAITLNVPSVKGITLVKFKVISNSKTSNIILVTPIINPVKISNCSSLNECSGKGECIDSKCICSSGFSGPDCSSTPTGVTSKPNTTPSISSFSSMIVLNELVELDINSKPVNSFPLSSDIWSSSTISSKIQNDSNAYQYVAKLGDTGSTITVVVDIFNKESKISFAGYNFQMDSGTIKYTISLNSYPFLNRLNTLQLNINASIDVADSKCQLNSIKLNEDNCVEWIKLRSDTESLYGKFIQHGLIDYRSINVQNKLIIEPTLENQHAVIGVQIPYFYQSAVLDPDFSVIFDYDDLAKNSKSSCYDLGTENGNEKSSSGLSKSKVIGISVACGIVGIACIVAAAYVIKNRQTMIRLKKKLSVTQ